MSTAIGLTQLVADLKYAAGPGAGKIASSVTASGNLQAKTNIIANVPGPGLRAVLADHGGQADRSSSAANNDQIPQIAAHMAADALQQGVALLLGHRQ